jgi:hypothetical protein
MSTPEKLQAIVADVEARDKLLRKQLDEAFARAATKEGEGQVKQQVQELFQQHAASYEQLRDVALSLQQQVQGLQQGVQTEVPQLQSQLHALQAQVAQLQVAVPAQAPAPAPGPAPEPEAPNGATVALANALQAIAGALAKDKEGDRWRELAELKPPVAPSAATVPQWVDRLRKSLLVEPLSRVVARRGERPVLEQLLLLWGAEPWVALLTPSGREAIHGGTVLGFLDDLVGRYSSDEQRRSLRNAALQEVKGVRAGEAVSAYLVRARCEVQQLRLAGGAVALGDLRDAVQEARDALGMQDTRRFQLSSYLADNKSEEAEEPAVWLLRLAKWACEREGIPLQELEGRVMGAYRLLSAPSSHESASTALPGPPSRGGLGDAMDVDALLKKVATLELEVAAFSGGQDDKRDKKVRWQDKQQQQGKSKGKQDKKKSGARTCFVCDKEGHMAAACPRGRPEEPGGN